MTRASTENKVSDLSVVADDSFYSAASAAAAPAATTAADTNTDTNIDRTTTTTTMYRDKNTAPGLAKVDEAFHHSTADTSSGHFTCTDANLRRAATKFTKISYAKSPVATTPDDVSPPPEGATMFPLPTLGISKSFRGRPSYWTDAEEKRLAVAVETCGAVIINWDLIAAMMPNRSRAACRKKWTKLADGWTLKEDVPLCEAVEACGEGNWDEIAARLPGRTMTSCRNRWAIIAESCRNRWPTSAEKASRSSSDRLPWTDEHETRLIHAVSTCVVGDWAAVGALVPGRSRVACREKWKRMMGKWSAEEDQELVLAIKTCGEGKWKKIAIMVPKRTIRQCRFRWTTLMQDASPVLGKDETEKTLTQVAETWDAEESDGIAETCSRQPRTNRDETKLIHTVNTGDSVVETVPGLSEVVCSGQPWTDKETKVAGPCPRPPRTNRDEAKLIHAVNTCDSIFETVPGLSEMAYLGQPWMDKETKVAGPCPRQPRTNGDEGKLIHAVNACDYSVVDTVPGSSGMAYLEQPWMDKETKVAGPYPRQPRTNGDEGKLIHAVNACDYSVVDTVPGWTEVAWRDEEIKKLVDAVKTHGEWEKWAAIAAMVPNRSEAECRLKWTSTTPTWTPQEDMLLAVAVGSCGKEVWLQVAERVPGRTMMDCLNRWTILAENASSDRLPRMSGGANNPVVASEPCGEESGAMIAAVVPGWSDFQKGIKRQRISPSVAALDNQAKDIPVNTTALRTPPFMSVNDGTWVSHQFPIPGHSNPHFHSKMQHMSPPAAALPDPPKGVPVNMTAPRSPPSLSVNNGTRVPHKLSPQAIILSFRHFPPI
jgi:hypothetical protein